MLDKIKQAQRERGCTNKELADVTGVSEQTVGRYLKGETDAPFEFVAKAAVHLGVSLNALAGIPEKSARDEMYEHIRELYEGQLKNKDEHIASLKRRIEKLETAHKEDHDDMRQRMDRKNKIIMRLFTALAVILALSVYFVVDAYNGDWGLVRYEESLRLRQEYAQELPTGSVPDVGGDGVVALWNGD